MNAFTSAYRKSFRENAHQLLWWGYEISKTRINSDSDEDTITQFIVEGMREKKKDPSTDAIYDFLSPHEQRRISYNGLTATSRPIVDIVFESQIRPFPSFSLEAKRLKASSNPIGDYVGSEGMGCFINEKYSEDEPDAAMVGYMQTHDATRWLKQLQRQFTLRGSSEFACCSALSPVSVLSDIQHEHVSVHMRPTKGELTLYHIFLDYT